MTFEHLFRIRRNYPQGNTVACGWQACAQITDDIFSASIDPVEFTHASLLLAQHSEEQPRNIYYYLSTLKDYFTVNSKSAYLDFKGAPTDRKRKLSEDMGVGLAALFMVKCYDKGRANT